MKKGKYYMSSNYKQEENLVNWTKRIILGVVALLVLIIVSCGSPYTVNSGTKSLVFTWGKITSTSNEGLHFKFPIAQSVTNVSVQTQKATVVVHGGTKDKQDIQLEIQLNFHPSESKLKEIYIRSGLDFQDKIILPRLLKIAKSVSAKYSAEEALTKRDLLQSDIEERLAKDLLEYDIISEGLALTDVQFKKEYNDAIEATQIAQQAVLTSENNLKRDSIEARRKIVTAQADSMVIVKQLNAIKQVGGENYLQKIAIEKWNGELPKYTGSNIPFILKE